MNAAPERNTYSVGERPLPCLLELGMYFLILGKSGPHWKALRVQRSQRDNILRRIQKEVFILYFMVLRFCLSIGRPILADHLNVYGSLRLYKVLSLLLSDY